MSNTTQVLNNAAAGTILSTDAGQYGNTVAGNFVNGVLRCHRIKDKAGLFQVALRATVNPTTCDVTLQGRPSPTAGWFNVLTVNLAAITADPNKTVVKVTTLYPEMRAQSVVSGGTAPLVSAWVTQ